MNMREYTNYKDASVNISHSMTPVPDISDFQMHTHGTAEILYFMRGRGVFHIEGTAYVPEPGDLLITYPSEAHYMEIDPSLPYERIVLNFETDMFRSMDPDGVLLKAFLERPAGKLNLYKDEQFQNGSSEPYFRKMLSSAGNQRINVLAGLMSLLNEIYGIYSLNANEVPSEAETLEYRIVRYVNRNLTEQISLDDICARYYVSKPQLCRLFKKATGTTVWQYITIKRLLRAKQLLQEGAAPTEVCAACGFADYSTFYRAYRKAYGTNPKAERN